MLNKRIIPQNLISRNQGDVYNRPGVQGRNCARMDDHIISSVERYMLKCLNDTT